MTIRPIQPYFSAGELSQNLYPRVDVDKYKSGLKRCRNFIIHPTGGASNRPGTRFVAEAKYANQESIVQEFIFSQEQKYVLEFGDEYVRFFTQGAPIEVESTDGEAVDSQTMLLLHFAGADGSTTITDSSASLHACVAQANAQIDTGASVFGGSSLILDGTGDYVSTSDSPAWDLGTLDFTIDCWVSLNNTSGNNMICARTTNGTSYFYFGFEANILRFRDYTGSNVIDIQRTVTISINTWYHVAVTRSGTSFRIFLDGTQQGATVVDATSLTARAVGLDIGAMTAAADYYMNGHIDEFRFSNGIARWVANFTPSPAEYGVVTTLTEPYEVTMPYQSTDLSLLRFETSADTIFITHPDYQTRVLQRFDNDDWRLSLYEPEDGPFMAENTDDSASLSVSAVTGDGITLSSNSAIFAALHVGALFKLKHYIEGQVVSQAFTSATTSSGIKCFTTWRIISHGTWTGKFKVEKSSDGGVTWTVLRTFSSTNDFNANTSGTEDIETNEVPFLVRINFYNYSSGTANIDLTTDPFFQEGIVKITAVATNISATADVLQEVGLTTATNSWFEGSWSDYRGYPAVSRFYQDRLVFAGTYTEPMTLWMTQTSNYFSFLRHSTLLDTDGITANLPSRQLNAINGLVAFKRLLVFTSASIWSVGPVSGSAMTPTGFTTEVEEYNGSNGINPVVIGNEAIYIQEHGHIASNIGFALATDSFTGADANILSSHLFDKWEIQDMAYQRNPDHIIWMLRSDGKLVGLTYLKDQEVVAFHWHDTGQATMDTFESLCVIPADGFDEVWFVANRENGRFIERMVLRMEAIECGGELEFSAQNQIFMDSVVSFDDPIDIEDLTINDDGDVIITIFDHPFSSGDTVFIDCVHGTDEINLQSFTLNTSSGDTDTLVLMHFNGTDNQTTTVDTSPYARTVTRRGSVLLDDDTLALGSASSYFPADGGTGTGGGTDYWEIPASNNFDSTFSNSSWTMEFRASFQIDNDGYTDFITWFTNAFSYINFGYVRAFGLNKLILGFRNGSGTLGTNIISTLTWEPELDTWYALAVVKDGSSYKFYINGEQHGDTVTDGNTLPSVSSTLLKIGTFQSGSPNRAFQGFLDELRISKVARYTGTSYDVSTREFLDSTNSFQLYLVGGTPLDGTGYGDYVSGGHIRESFDEFEGLDHLEGQEVAILADGEVLPNQTVVDGTISLTNPASQVHIGLPYDSDFQTLAIELPLSDGSTVGRQVKISNVTFRLLNSRGGKLGPNEDNLYEAFTTTSLASATQISETIGVDNARLFSCDIRLPLGASYEKAGSIFYRQTNPLPITIGAVVPEINVGKPSMNK